MTLFFKQNIILFTFSELPLIVFSLYYIKMSCSITSWPMSNFKIAWDFFCRTCKCTLSILIVFQGGGGARPTRETNHGLQGDLPRCRTNQVPDASAT